MKILLLSALLGLEAKPVEQVINAISSADFTYHERGLVFGYNSIQSCLYLSDTIAIIKNYCYPVKNYPARGYTIISRDFGIIDLYEEKISGLIKRDIYISQFAENLAPYLSFELPNTNLQTLSSVIEKMYYKNLPACWSTNLGDNTSSVDVNCTLPMSEVHFSSEWGKETQSIVNDEMKWSQLMNSVEGSLKAIEQ